MNYLAVLLLGSMCEGGKNGGLYQMRGWKKYCKEKDTRNLTTVDTTEEKIMVSNTALATKIFA